MSVEYTREQVAAHDTAGSLFVIIHGIVYDLTAFVWQVCSVEEGKGEGEGGKRREAVPCSQRGVCSIQEAWKFFSSAEVQIHTFLIYCSILPTQSPPSPPSRQ